MRQGACAMSRESEIRCEAGRAEPAHRRAMPSQLVERIVEAAPVALIVVDLSGEIVFLNDEVERLFGYGRGELLGKGVELLVPERNRTAHAVSRERFLSAPMTRKMGAGRELVGRHKDGSTFPVEVALKPLQTAEGMYVLSVVIDVRPRQRLERRVSEMIDIAPLAMLLVEQDGMIAQVNREAERLYGYAREALIGASVEKLVPKRFRLDDPVRRGRLLRVTHVRRLGGPGRDFFGLHRDGNEFPIEVMLKPISSDGRVQTLISVVDISPRRRMEEQIRSANQVLELRVAERTRELEAANLEKEVLLRDLEMRGRELERLCREDSLTALVNRRGFDEQLEREMHRTRRSGVGFVVAIFDIDHFKRVNDHFGHALGDAVLHAVADLMRREIRAVDVLARYGGEEFALILPDSNLPSGIRSCERIRKRFESFDWGTLAPGLAIRVSAGVAAWMKGQSKESLLAEADRFLYAAKHNGRNCVRPLLTANSEQASINAN